MDKIAVIIMLAVMLLFGKCMCEARKFCQENPQKCVQTKQEKDDTCIITDSCAVDVLILDSMF